MHLLCKSIETMVLFCPAALCFPHDHENVFGISRLRRNSSVLIRVTVTILILFVAMFIKLVELVD